MKRIINQPSTTPMRWFLHHSTHGYLSSPNKFNEDPFNSMYFDGFDSSTEEEIKETFEGFTGDIPMDEFDVVGMYGFEWEWDY